MPRPKHEQPGFVLLRSLMEDGEQFDVRKAVDALGLNRSTCREYLAILHKAGHTRITGWSQTNQRGRWYATFAWGRGEDAPKPGPPERNSRRRLKRTVDARGIDYLIIRSLMR